MSTPLQTKTAKSIKGKIEYWVKKNSFGNPIYKKWYIGITKDPYIRHNQHKSKLGDKPYYFEYWYARSYDIAAAIETSFHNKGMKEKDSKGGAKYDSWYVYVYKIDPHFLDRLLV